LLDETREEGIFETQAASRGIRPPEQPIEAIMDDMASVIPPANRSYDTDVVQLACYG